MLLPWCLSGGAAGKCAPGQRPEPGSLPAAGDGRIWRRLAGGCGAQGRRWQGAGGTALLLLAQKTPTKPSRAIQVRGRIAKSPNVLKRQVKSQLSVVVVDGFRAADI